MSLLRTFQKRQPFCPSDNVLLDEFFFLRSLLRSREHPLSSQPFSRCVVLIRPFFLKKRIFLLIDRAGSFFPCANGASFQPFVVRSSLQSICSPSSPPPRSLAFFFIFVLSGLGKTMFSRYVPRWQGFARQVLSARLQSHHRFSCLAVTRTSEVPRPQHLSSRVAISFSFLAARGLGSLRPAAMVRSHRRGFSVFSDTRHKLAFLMLAPWWMLPSSLQLKFSSPPPRS